MPRSFFSILLWVLILIGLYATTHYSYLLFHTGVELFSISVAWLMFGMIWTVSDREIDGLYLVLGTGYLFVGFVDLVHTLAYKGMNIFRGFDANLPTQLWICARYMESFTLLGAQFYMNKKVRMEGLVLLYALLTGLLMVLIFSRNFPDCYLEGKGLTTFKVASEYLISLILVYSLLRMRKHRENLDRLVYRLLFAAIGFTIGAELFFTFYISVYDISNMMGHYFKLVSFYFVYEAIVHTTIREPLRTVYLQLQKRTEELNAEREQLIEAMKRIKTLEGILPICASCKRIMKDDGTWVQIESYITERSQAKFSHGICPDCAAKLYPEIFKKKR